MSEEIQKTEEEFDPTAQSWFEVLKALFWVIWMWIAGAGLLTLAAQAVHTGRIKNRAGPESYDYYSEEPVVFLVQLALMIIIGLPIFLGMSYVIVRVVRRKLGVIP